MTQIFTKKHRGFTLIELLVVIAVIGLLSTIVLIALGGARDRAHDSRIISQMAQIRSGAEIHYAAGLTYTGLSCTLTTPVNFSLLCTDIDAQNGGTGGQPTIQVNTAGTVYCAWANMRTAGRFYCVDSRGRAIETTTPPSGAGLCTTATFVCP